jgi:hypothetical protein
VILEGLVSTIGDEGATNIAPMGPLVDESLSWLVLRPFRTSTTYRNLAARRCGVLHVVDDVLLLVQAAIGRIDSPPPTQRAVKVDGVVLSDACRWLEFVVQEIDDTSDRARMEARVVHTGRLRDFFGFNRAKHAVIEAAILATRLDLLPPDQVRAEMARLRSPVEKTAGPRELQAFSLLEAYTAERLGPVF